MKKNMKRILTLATAVFALSISALAQETVNKTYDFGDFNGIKAGYVHKIYITEGKSDKIEVTCPEKYVEYLDYSVSNGILNLNINLPNYKRKWKYDEDIIVKVQMERIESISLSGAAELIPDGSFRADEAEIDLSGSSKILRTLNLRAKSLDFDLSGASEGSMTGTFNKAEGDVSGAADFTMNADANTLEVKVSGASKYTYTGNAESIEIGCSGASSANLKGETDEIEIKCSGASKVNAKDMIADNAKASASGASTIHVYGNNRLELSSSGASSIKYYGDAKDVRMTNQSITRGK